MKPSIPTYLETWSRELLARADRVRLLIGDAHWLSDGHHREAIIREFLARYLPPQVLLSRGFVCPPAEERCSPEIDLLLADPARHPPLFNEGGLLIVPPTSVLAHLEIKTTFEKAKVVEALDSVARTQRASQGFVDLSQVWRSICFFNVPSSRTPDSILKTIEDGIDEVLTEIGADAHIRPVDLLPNCISTLSDFVVLLRPGQEDKSCELRLFESGETSLAYALADLLGAIRYHFGGTTMGELDDMIESMSPTLSSTRTIKLK